jgi:hypothetical protein
LPIINPDAVVERQHAQRIPKQQRDPNEENRDINLVGQPVTLSRTPSKMVARLPEFGEQTDEVLAEFGFTADKIAELRQPKLAAFGGLTCSFPARSVQIRSQPLNRFIRRLSTWRRRVEVLSPRRAGSNCRPRHT